jgi:streptogramin lyase
VSFGGKVMAGNLPIVGASIQLYAAGSAGNGSAATSLLTNKLTTDAAGAYTVPAGYFCPAPASQLYVIASGGQVGGAASNPAIMLTTTLGMCNQIAASSQFVVNEVTTVASVWALAQFLSTGGNVGAASTNAQGLANAVATVAGLVNLTNGTAPGANFSAAGKSPAPRINSLANLLHACTTSSIACTALFSATTSSGGTVPGNTLDAALDLALNAGNNVAALYTQSTANAFFTPALTSAPADWTLFINYTGGGMSSPDSVAIDGAGNVWVSSYLSAVSEFSPTGVPLYPNGLTSGGLLDSRAVAVDAQNNAWIANEDSVGVNNNLGSITVFNSAGQLVSGATGYVAGGLYYPIAIAIDNNATSWILNFGNSSLTLLSSSGKALSGAAGYTSPKLVFPVAIALDANHNGWVANNSGDTVTKVAPDGSQFTDYACCNGAAGIAIDQHGYVWVANYYGDSVSQLANDGTVVSSGYNDNGASIQNPQGIAIDGSGHVWVANFRGPSLTELAGSASASPGQILSPTSGYASEAAMLEGSAVAIDASGNIWVPDFGNDTLTEIIGLATPVKTPQLGPVQAP